MYFTIIYKTIFFYFFIIFIYRILGKKEIGQLSIVDLIVSILIVELSAIGIEEKNESILLAIIPIIIIVSIQIIISYVSLKSIKFRNFVEGKPTVIIKNGQINFSEMLKIRYNIDDLLTQLREQGIGNIEKVKYAILENSGNLSVFEKTSDYPMPIIIDGKIDYFILKEIKKNKKWLDKILNERNLKVEDVFYAFYSSNNTYIITKEELI
ncbi:MAG: DUF421 domain-containing protein [Bacilli bacterium]|nr:DUF421 domain-containing protein [Bacilli bacterium]